MKRFLLLLSIALLVILVYVSIVFKPKHQEKETLPPPPTPTQIITPSTAPDISYKNTTYGFSFTYPNDWQILEEPNVFGMELQKVDNEGGGLSIAVRIIDNLQKLPLKDFAQSQAFAQPSGEVESPAPIMVGTLQGYQLHHLPQDIILMAYLPYKLPNKVIYIFAGGEYQKSPQTIAYFHAVLQKVLTSFKTY